MPWKYSGKGDLFQLVHRPRGYQSDESKRKRKVTVDMLHMAATYATKMFRMFVLFD